jgi:uncharacterized protein YbjT (DUF2867 family)
MQNYLHFGAADTIRSKGVFYSPLGAARTSPIDTRDISEIGVRVLTEPGHEGRRYDLTGGDSLSDGEMADILSGELGRKVTYIAITQAQAREAMAAAGTPAWLVEVLGELNEIAAKGYLAAVAPDAEAILKRKPKSFAQFVRDHFGAFAA